MLYGLVITLFVVLCLMIILIILLQKGKSSMGLGGLGGGTQLLFGGSQGQDLFQKVTWAMGAIFMVGSLLLAMVKRPTASELLGTLARTQPAPVVMPQSKAAQEAEAKAVATAQSGKPAESIEQSEAAVAEVQQ